MILSLICSNLAIHSHLFFFDLGFVSSVFYNNCNHLLLLLVSMLHDLCVVAYIAYVDDFRVKDLLSPGVVEVDKPALLLLLLLF